MKRTISAEVGKGSVNHNSRKFKAANVDPERTHLNVEYCNEPIKKVYHKLFDEALERYNSKQTRSDRQIENYYEKIRTGKQEKPFHELIIQIGNRDDTGSGTEIGEQAKAALDKPEPYRVDLALFLNGIPLVMIELKKQTAGQRAVFEGTKQFQTTRNPDELIFSFNRRTLIYFTLDEFAAFLTTRLDRKETKFLPFNRGSEDEGAGNPVVPGKHSTCYVWEDILQRDMLLRIIREFMFIDDEGAMIFPRWHQLRAVLRCEKDVKENGIGGRYLIWHSAGSGKTKTIAWLAKRLINNPAINTVIVISDRTVIDGQLGAELMNVDGKKGVAQHIDTTSKDLLKKLNDGGYIIVTTLQKFRPILNEIKRNEERNYAIIIDEAHSSTAGKSMSKASETLTGKSLKESVELDDIYDDLEDGQNQLIRDGVAIRSTRNVSYFAFTATPKKETMELFGTRTEIGKTYFDKYSMKQAIEERFILNPLLCYNSSLVCD